DRGGRDDWRAVWLGDSDATPLERAHARNEEWTRRRARPPALVRKTRPEWFGLSLWPLLADVSRWSLLLGARRVRPAPPLVGLLASGIPDGQPSAEFLPQPLRPVAPEGVGQQVGRSQPRRTSLL